MSKKPSKKPKRAGKKEWTAEKILELWVKTCTKAAKPKKFEKDVFKEFEPKLLAAIQEHLDGPTPAKPNTFTKKDEVNTKILAGILGKICLLLTITTKEISVDTFQEVFELIKSHPLCPGGGGGAGEWCSID